MQSEPGELFDQLDPPPGGVAGLRRRLRNEPRRRRRHVATAALGGALVVGGLSVTLYRQLAQPDQVQARLADFDPALVALGLQDAPSEPAAIPPEMRHRMALERVPLDTERVVFYFVSSLPDPSPATSSTDAEQEEPSEDPEAERDSTLEEVSVEG
jgi:hypothetical protein